MSNIGVVTVAYNSGNGLARLIDSIFADTKLSVRVYVYLHSLHQPTVRACQAVSSKYDTVDVIDVGGNKGVARAWNNGAIKAYDEGCDRVIITNDDVIFPRGDLDRLVEASLSTDDKFITTCSGWHAGRNERIPSHGFSCFALNPTALDKVGCFDENFFPAYFEDCDYFYRGRLQGLDENICTSTGIIHFGSATIKRDEKVNRANAKWFADNQAYYIRKWGGSNGHEKFTTPFDNGYSLKIDPANRHNPYAKFDRADLEAES